MLSGTAKLEVDLVPFSEEEEADTRRWYAEALRSEPVGPASQVSESGTSQTPGLLTPVLDAVTLTSIKRHGVLRFSWSTRIEGSP